VNQAAIVVAHPDGPAHVELVSRDTLAQLWDDWCARCDAFPAAIAAAQQRQDEKRASVLGAFQW